MQSVYTCIKDSNFGMMESHPITTDDMHVLIDYSDPYGLIDHDIRCKICNNTNMSELQLNAIIILSEKMSKIVQDVGHKVFTILNKSSLFSDHRFPSYETISTDFNSSLIPLVKAIKDENNFYNKTVDLMFDGEINNIVSVKKNPDIFKKLISNIRNEIMAIIEKYILENTKIIDICTKNSLTNNDTEQLSNFDSENKNLLIVNLCEKWKKNPIVKKFNEYMADTYNNSIDEFYNLDFEDDYYYYNKKNMDDRDYFESLDYDDYYYRNKTNLDDWDYLEGWNTYSYNDKQSLEEIRTKIKKITKKYELADIYYYTEYFHSLDKCFIEHKMINSKSEFAERMIETFVNHKNDIGFVNKYDTITIQNHYELTAFKDDTDLTYEKFLEWLGKYKELPSEYPLETILRIVSRYFNISINFYTEHGINSFIDNMHDESSPTITIFQFSKHKFYNLVPVGKKFIPIGNTSGIPFSKMEVIEI